MKKQILFLTFFVAAILAGMNSYGQYVTNLTAADAASVDCTPAVPLGCAEADDELHPLPGKIYSYGITTDPVTVASVHWFVTDQADVITYTAGAPVLQAARDVVDGTYILTATAGVYDTPGAAKTIDISWKQFDLSNQVLLVAYVEGADGCSDNVEVYRIEPVFNFTLDIAGLLDDGTLGNEECVSPVESAVYTGGTDLTMDYGENWVFFTVNAANFVNSWDATLTAAVTGGSTIGAVEWAYPAEAITGTWHADTDPIVAQDASGAVGTAGECIVVRVEVQHGNNELANDVAAAVVTLGIDGVMFDPAGTTGNEYANGGLADLDEPATSGDPCVNNVTDEATYTLTPRPDLLTDTTVGTGDKPFEPKN